LHAQGSRQFAAPLMRGVRRHVKLIMLIGAVVLMSFGARAQDRETGDFNFDGHLDYREPSGEPGNQCGWWRYYIYDPSVSQHRSVETSLCKEQFDAERKLVRSEVSGGMAGLIYAIRYFRWDAFTLVAVSAEKQDYDSERNLFIRTQVTNIDSISGPTVVARILRPEEANVRANQ
jgi:hypothetical protein